MMYEIKLPSGMTVSPNAGIVGLDEDGELYEGYDARLGPVDEPWADLSLADKVFLAELMINRWQAFRASLEAEAAALKRP